jgi:hypothetical protein
MNRFLKEFSDKYLNEIQNVATSDGSGNISWFDESELEDIMDASKNVVSKHLSSLGYECLLERSMFADDIDHIICLCMAYNCLKRIINPKSRNEKLKGDPRLSSIFKRKDLESFSNLLGEYDYRINEAFDSIFERAEQVPEKPKVSPVQS